MLHEISVNIVAENIILIECDMLGNKNVQEMYTEQSVCESTEYVEREREKENTWLQEMYYIGSSD